MGRRALDAQAASFFDLDAASKRRAQQKLGLRYLCWCGITHHRPTRYRPVHHGIKDIRKILNVRLQAIIDKVHFEIIYQKLYCTYNGEAVADALGVTEGIKKLYKEWLQCKS